MVSPFLDPMRMIIFYHTLLQAITSNKALLLNCILSSQIIKSTSLFLYFFFIISEKLRYIHLLYF